MQDSNESRLLATGAAAGFLLAVSGVLDSSSWSDTGFAGNVVAVVNSQPIAADEFDRRVDALEQSRKRQLDVNERRLVLQRLMEERLIIEHGVAIGLPGSDPLVSKAIRRAMLDTVTAEARASEPDEKQLREFLDNNIEYFSRPGELRIQQMIIQAGDGGDAVERAATATKKLQAGEDWSLVAGEFGSAPVVRLPDRLLPVHKLQQYLGSSLAEIALQLTVGEFSQPQARGDSQVILHLVEATAVQAPAFAEVSELVKSEYRRREAEQAVNAFRERLRREASIEVNEELLTL